MAAKTFDELFSALKVLRVDPNEDDFRMFYNAATKAAEEKFTSTNSQSDEIAALRKELQALREVVGHHQSFVGLHTPLGGNSARLV